MAHTKTIDVNPFTKQADGNTDTLKAMAFEALSTIQDGAQTCTVQHYIGDIYVCFNAIGMQVGVWTIAPLSAPAQVVTTTSVTEAEKLLAAFINTTPEGEPEYAADGI